jgi:HD-GYP domain-containing protein (c-di-GMP phosphodiesterase class II)
MSALKPTQQLPIDGLFNEAHCALKYYERACELLRDFTKRPQHGSSTNELGDIIEHFVSMLRLDADLLATVVSMRNLEAEYLFNHSVDAALLSMTIADQAGFSREQLTEVGLGAVFMDVGMARVPARIRLADHPITASERAELGRHPLYTAAILEHVPGLSPVVRYVGYQAHERGDGSGYPNGRTVVGIHPFARIVAIADVYAAMSQARPYRGPIGPHEAIKQILMQGCHNRLDRSMIRPFLDRMSVFPIGTRVQLDNGMFCRVVRANPALHTRPVVVEDKDAVRGTLIDLSAHDDLDIVRVFQSEPLRLLNPANTPSQSTPTQRARSPEIPFACAASAVQEAT